MQSHDEIIVPVSPKEVTIYVAIEISGKSWVQADFSNASQNDL